MNSIRVQLALCVLLAGSTVHAHQIWLEPDGANGAQLRFGEYGENLRETSPGLLDKFVAPAAWHVSAKGERSAPLAKAAEGFALPVRAKAGESLVAEDAGYPIREVKQGDKTTRALYHPAARLVADWRAQAPKLRLDVVPTGKPGEVQVLFKGQPLARAKLAVVTASGWTQEHRTDEQGKARFATPWRGGYLVEVSHADKTPGERQGAQGTAETYDSATYVSTLFFNQSKGLPALPARPKATPNQ